MVWYGVVPYIRYHPNGLDMQTAICWICHLSQAFFVAGLSSSSIATVDIWPHTVALKDVTHDYPDSMWRRLTSSVPRRSQALSDVSLEFPSSEFCLLTGPSDSGKSTIFRLLQGIEQPSISGSVEMDASSLESPKRFSVSSEGPTAAISEVAVAVKGGPILPPSCVALPVILDERPMLDPSTSPVQYFLRQPGSRGTTEAIVNVLFHVLGATDWMETIISELSQSQLYIVELVEASLQSMTHSAAPPRHHPEQQTKESSSSTCNNRRSLQTYPAPILLLDEWLDKETSSVIQRVQATLQRFCHATGAVVVCSTHVPDRFSPRHDDSSTSYRHVELQSGRVLASHNHYTKRQVDDLTR